MLNSGLSTFTRTRNAPAELQRYQMKFSRESILHNIFLRFFQDQTRLENLTLSALTCLFVCFLVTCQKFVATPVLRVSLSTPSSP